MFIIRAKTEKSVENLKKFLVETQKRKYNLVCKTSLFAENPYSIQFEYTKVPKAVLKVPAVVKNIQHGIKLQLLQEYGGEISDYEVEYND